jgi:hypothetical protein
LASAWARIVADSTRDSIFVALLDTATPAGRLYALAGLAAINSPALGLSLSRIESDTAQVRFVTIGQQRSPQTVSLRELVNADAVRHWADVLRRMAAGKCAA